MALVIASQLRKELSGWQLFDGVSFKVERRDRIALSGPNGAGKTTLLRILNGETDYQGGELVLSKGTRVALHDQRPPLEQGLTLREYVLSGASDLVATEKELRTLEQQMAAGAHDQATLRHYADAQARLEWLEQELQSLDAGIILVAHDRWFLEAVTNGVLELGGGRSVYFAGPWHAWRIEKAARASAAGKTADRLTVDIARLERFVERFRYKKEKARQAQAKLTQIRRLEREREQATNELQSLTLRNKRLGFEFLDPPRSGRTVIESRGLEIAAGDKALLHDVA